MSAASQGHGEGHGQRYGEWYRGTSSWVWAALALIAVVVVIGIDIADGWHWPIFFATLLFAVLAYVAILRPRVGIEGGDLVLHHMYSTQRLPVAAVETVSIGRTFEATAGGRHYVSAAVSRSLRAVFKGSGRRDPQANYADFVEERVLLLASDARVQAGVRQDSDEQFALADDVRRTWSWPLIAATVAPAAALAVSLLV